MSRLFAAGAEISVLSSTPDASSVTGTVTRDTSNQRTGSACYKFDTGAGNAAAHCAFPVPTTAANRLFYGRAYVMFPALPASSGTFFTGISTATGAAARLTSGGKVQFWDEAAGTQVGSDSAATVATGTYYRIEMLLTVNASNTAITTIELRLDGTTVATGTFTGGSFGGQFDVGWQVGALPGANTVMYADDLASNDNQGSVNNSWAGSGKVILMAPISDNARGAFTGGAGGTTNLWDAINNTPPVGVADASATDTSQIKNKTTTNPTSYDGNLDTYTNAGIGTTDTINSIQVWVNTGEDSATGTKAGTAQMVSNPAIGTVSFNFGNDAGAQGTYVGNWFWSKTAFSEAPSVTLGTAPVIRITCTSGATGTRAAGCDFLGAYVEYTPAVPVTLYSQPCNLGNSPGMLSRALGWGWWRRRLRSMLQPDLWTPSPE